MMVRELKELIQEMRRLMKQEADNQGVAATNVFGGRTAIAQQLDATVKKLVRQADAWPAIRPDSSALEQYADAALRAAGMAISGFIPPAMDLPTLRYNADRSLNFLERWFAGAESGDQPIAAAHGDWEFLPGRFQYKQSGWHDLSAQPFSLLCRFVKAPGMELTHNQIQLAVGESSRPAANLVADLNRALCKALGLNENPIRSIRGYDLYRLTMPAG